MLIMRLGSGVVLPGNRNESRRKLGDYRRVLHHDVTPSHHRFPVLLKETIDIVQLPDEQLRGL